MKLLGKFRGVGKEERQYCKPQNINSTKHEENTNIPILIQTYTAQHYRNTKHLKTIRPNPTVPHNKLQRNPRQKTAKHKKRNNRNQHKTAQVIQKSTNTLPVLANYKYIQTQHSDKGQYNIATKSNATQKKHNPATHHMKVSRTFPPLDTYKHNTQQQKRTQDANTIQQSRNTTLQHTTKNTPCLTYKLTQMTETQSNKFNTISTQPCNTPHNPRNTLLALPDS